MAPETNGQQPGVLTSSDRLRKIDKLRERKLGTCLALPQLVAVGDQSSGKSSLLESLTGIPFPRGQELCTRYATQISSRRNEHSYIDITVKPPASLTQEEQWILSSFHKQLDSTEQLRAEFPTILDEVNTLLGVCTSKTPDGAHTFSRSVLKIEKCGPEEDCLTVIDVPGIFRTTTETTTTEDRDMVKQMVESCIGDSQTVILAVLPANVDVATQEILSLAEECDKTGERTLGILTKPDLVREHSGREAVCNLVLGKRKALRLGYYLVCNRGGDDNDDEKDSRQTQRDDMFQKDPWCHLPKDRMGIAALRDTLQELLGDITDKAFPKLRLLACQKLATSQESLEMLGSPRQTEREQQLYLTAMASKFQSLVRAASNADYTTHEFLEHDESRLITAVATLTSEFDDDFSSFSHTYSFKQVRAEAGEDSEANKDGGTDETDKGHAISGFLERAFSQDLKDFPELRRILVDQTTFADAKSGIMDWIRLLYRRSRGIELGTFSSSMLSSTFREQSAKWGPITQHYLSKIILVMHKFIMNALWEACDDTWVMDEVISTSMGSLLDSYEASMRHATFLVDIEREKKPYTLNHYFNNNLQKCRGARLEDDLQRRREALKKTISDMEEAIEILR